MFYVRIIEGSLSHKSRNLCVFKCHTFV